jgi:hypothetical protein
MTLNEEEEYYDFDSFKEVFLSNFPDKLQLTDKGKEFLRRRREETLDTEGLFVAYTDSGKAYFVPTTKFLSLPTLMRLDILKDWIMGLMNYYSLVGEDWLEEIEEEQNE